MTNKRNIKMTLVISLLALALFIQAPQAHAWGWGWGGPRHFYPHGRGFDVLPLAAATLIIAGATYYYAEGEYYQRMGNQYVVTPAPVGAVVTTIPQGYQPVIIDGVTYYTINGVTYMYTPSGFQVVPPPKPLVIQTTTAGQGAPPVSAFVQPAPIPQGVGIPATSTYAEESFTVNISNSKGGHTPVTLKRSGNGFIGPQGEFYTEFPRIEQLKLMYAK